MSYPDWDTPLSKQDVSPRELRLAQNEIDALPTGALSGGANKGPVASGPPAKAGASLVRGGIEFDITDYGAGDASVVTKAVTTAAIKAAMVAANAAWLAGNGMSKLWCPPQPNGYALKRSDPAQQMSGGIQMLPGVSLYGSKTKLLLQDDSPFITTRGLHNGAAWTVTDITGDIHYGDQQLQVTSTTGISAGQDIYVTANQNRYDTTSQGYSFWAIVKSKDDATHLTLDRPILTTMFVSAQAVPVLADGGAGALPAGLYTFGYTFVTGGAVTGGTTQGGLETEISPTSQITIGANRQITPTAIALPTGCSAVKWYIVANTAGATNGLVATRFDGTAFNVNVQGNGIAAPDKSISLSGTPGGGSGGFRWVAAADSVVQDSEIDGFDLICDAANGGSPEFGISLQYCKNVSYRRISSSDAGIAVHASNCEQIKGEQIRARSINAFGNPNWGRLVGGWNVWNMTLDDLHVEGHDGPAVFLENQCRGVQLRRLHVVMNTTRARQASAILAIGQESEVTVDGMIVEGFGGTLGGQGVDLFDSGGTPAYVLIRDLEVRTATDVRFIPLSIIKGKLILGPQSPVAGHYVEAKRFTRAFQLTPNMSNVDVGLPAGLIKRLRIYVSAKTGITAFFLGYMVAPGAGGQGSPDMTANLVAGKLVEFQNWGNIGTNYPTNNSALGKGTAIYTDGTVPAGAYGVIEMEFFEKINDFPSTQAAAVDDTLKGFGTESRILLGDVTLLGKVSTVKGIGTSGPGVPPIRASYAATGLVAAVANAINYTPPALAGSYRLHIHYRPTATGASTSVGVTVTYRDSTGAISLTTLPFVRRSTAALAAPPFLNTGADDLYVDFPFEIDNSATAITVSTTGTFTGTTYNLAATLEEVA